MAWEIPSPTVLVPERLRFVLEYLGVDVTADWFLDDVRRIVPTVAVDPAGGSRSFHSGPYRVFWYPAGVGIRAIDTTCSCPSRSMCAHRAAFTVVAAFNDRVSRDLFVIRPWEMALQSILSADRRVDGDKKPPRPARFEYTLRPPDHLAGAQHLRIDVQIFFVRARGGGELKPKSAPRSLDAIHEKVGPVAEVDDTALAIWSDLEAMHELANRTWSKSKHVIETLQRRTRDLVRALQRVQTVLFDGTPVTIRNELFAPHIDVQAAPDGGLSLAWSEKAVCAWEADNLVLTEARELRPVAANAPEPVRRARQPALPPIPLHDAVSFLDEAGPRLPLVVDGPIPGALEAQGPTGRIKLCEDSGALLIEAVSCYVVNGEDAEVSFDTISAVGHHTGALFVRQPDAEEALRVAALTLPSRLVGDDALDFLSEDLTDLRRDWEIFGEAGLSRMRVSGRVSVRVSIPTGIDWFDLEVKFSAEGAEISADRVLQTWLQGRRFLRLEDGTLAKLPVAWLRRHAETAGELMDLKRSASRLGDHVLPAMVPLLDDPLTRRDLSHDVEVLDHWRQVARNLSSFDGIAPRAVPATVTASLRSYQVDGFRWLAFLRDHRLGGCLADDMGLGKTVQTLALLADSHATPGKPSLVVAPNSVIHNWRLEAERFVPSLRVVVHHGTQRATAIDDEADVVVTTYALLRSDPALARPWRHVVLDEAQNIKNPASQVSKAARRVDAEHRLALTGTPIENNLLELWSLFEFLMPGFFASQRAYQNRYVKPIRSGNGEAGDRLRGRIRPFLLRRLKSEVLAELPPKQTMVLTCELSPEERGLYDQVRNTYRESVMRQVDEEGVGRATLHILEALTRLRQACCHPDLLPFEEAREVRHSAKVTLALEVLDDAMADGHRTLVFSQWPSLLKIIRSNLESRSIPFLYLDGSTTGRLGLQSRWNAEDGPPIFLISIKAGGSGMNLTGADHVIHLDPWWNPAVEEQATDRAHRIGQTRPVLVYKIVAANTVEERILELQDRKRDLFERTVETNRLAAAQLTREDLQAVFDVGEDA